MIHSRYRLTEKDYYLMLEKQSNCCARCDEPFKNQTPHVDHNHFCCPSGFTCGKCVRALVCRDCNTTIGHYEKGNVQVISWRANRIKSNASLEELVKIGEWAKSVL